MNQKEIAEHFNISQSTVSIALTRPDSSRISHKLRREILKYCQINAPNYLRSARTWNIGFVGHENYCASPFYATLFSGISQVASTLDYTLFVEGEKKCFQQCSYSKFDGIIDARREFEVKQKFPAKLPQILLNNTREDASLDCVMPDNAAVISLAFRHLLETGHRRIGFFAFNTVDRPHGMSVHMRERLNTFLMLCQKYDISQEYCRTLNVTDEPDWDNGELRAVLHEYVQQGNLPDSLIFPDSCVVELFAALKAEGLRVPEDISIVGWDNIDKFSTMPFMTSVDFNLAEMGRIALETLHWRIENPDKPHRRINVEPKLIIRNSVKTR